jgi:hypothetical protein
MKFITVRRKDAHEALIFIRLIFLKARAEPAHDADEIAAQKAAEIADRRPAGRDEARITAVPPAEQAERQRVNKGSGSTIADA